MLTYPSGGVSAVASFSDLKERMRQLPKRNAEGGKNADAQTAAAVSPRLYSHKRVRILYPWREKIINKRQLCATVGASHRRYFILWGCGPEPLLYFCYSGSPKSVAFVPHIHLGKSAEETFGNGAIDKIPTRFLCRENHFNVRVRQSWISTAKVDHE